MNASQTVPPPFLTAAPPLASADALRLLRAIDYDWTMLLRSVWTDPPFDSPEIHTEVREDFREALVRLKGAAGGASPPGWLLAGLRRRVGCWRG